VSDAYSSGEDSPIFERKIIEVNPGRISRIKETILGATFVGEGVFLCDGRDGNTRDDRRIYRTPV
jgi:hypothetical protein